MHHKPRAGKITFAILAMLLWAPAAVGQLVSKVEPGWSPFVRAPAPPEVKALVEEARNLLGSNPSRVAEVLAKADPSPGPAKRTVVGLRADALYHAGGGALFEAQKGYRAVVTSSPEPEEAAWAHFMLANIHKGMGFIREADIEYRAALNGPPGPWSAALAFNLAVLELETDRHVEARDRLTRWLQDYPTEPGRPLVLFLLGECEAALGGARSAMTRFDGARALDPDAWVVRPEIGFAMADLLSQEGQVTEAVATLDTLARDFPGTREGAWARLKIGQFWLGSGEVAPAAASYARLLDEGAGPEESREARLRLALLGVEYADRVEFNEPFPAYRVFYRPRPTLEEFASGREPLAAQRALQGLALLARRDGDRREALWLLAQVFEDYPESPESGRAYEAFMDLFEAYLSERLDAGAYVEVVEVYEALRAPMGWVPTRDVGLAASKGAEAYEALGAPVLARQIYETLLGSGTRALGDEELRNRVLRTRAREGEPEAVRRWSELRPEDWQAHRMWARQLAEAGEVALARQVYAEAARLADEPGQKLALLHEADRLEDPARGAEQRLAALEARQALWQAIPEGPERDRWKAHYGLVEARLRFAVGQYAEATRIFGSVAELTPADKYLLALATARAGRSEQATEMFGFLVEDGDPLFASLAGLYLELDALRGVASREVL